MKKVDLDDEPKLSKSQMKKNKRAQKQANKAGFGALNDSEGEEEEPVQVPVKSSGGKKGGFAAFAMSDEDDEEEEEQSEPEPEPGRVIIF